MSADSPLPRLPLSLFAAVLGCGLASWNLWRLNDQRGTRTARRGLLFTAAFAAPALAHCGSVVLGLLSLSLGATLAAGEFWRRRTTASGSLLIASTVLCALVLEGVFYAELPPAAAAMLAMAPSVVAWLTSGASARGAPPPSPGTP